MMKTRGDSSCDGNVLSSFKVFCETYRYFWIRAGLVLVNRKKVFSRNYGKTEIMERIPFATIESLETHLRALRKILVLCGKGAAEEEKALEADCFRGREGDLHLERKWRGMPCHATLFIVPALPLAAYHLP